MENDKSSVGHESFEQFSAHSLEELAVQGLRSSIEQAKEQKNEQAAQKEKTKKQVVDNFVRSNKASLMAFSGDKTIRYVPSTTAETMAFYPEEGKIELPTKWFNGEYNDGELLFSCGHEIAHFRDMRKNPEAYFGSFEYMEAKGKELAKDYRDKYPEQGSEESMAGFFAEELRFLYNCLDDIYVNKLTMDKAPTFYYDKKDVVLSLYEKWGFKEPDLTGEPLHRQMVFALLRDEMVGDVFGKSVVDERVQKVLDKRKMGKTSRELVDAELKPIAGTLIDPERRYKIIKQFLEKDYLKLLDLESSGGKFNPFGDNKKQPKTILGERTIEEEKEILNDILEQDKIDKMSPEEKAEYNKQKQQEIFDNNHNIDPEERKEYNETVKNIETERKKMRKFWDGLIGKSISFERNLVYDQKKGRLNVDSLIRQYPDFIEAQNNGKLDELTIYDRHQMERIVVNKPEEIEITLLVDGSGSMGGESMKVAREAAALLMLSIKDFNSKLEASRKETHSKLVAKTEVVMFGSDYETVKDFEKTARFDETNETNIIKSVSRMQAEYGGTDDASPLKEISSGITSEQKTKIDKEKLLKIVFEITDGKPDDENETKLAVEKLKSEGVLAFAFQIGEQNEAFEYIWNDSDNPTGIFIGDNVKSLPDNLVQTLSSVMKGVRI